MAITAQSADAAPLRANGSDSERIALPAVSGHQPALDGLRVIAALAVLVLHVSGQTGFEFTGTPASWLVSRGDIGVPIFFALSGLLLYRPWARTTLTGSGWPGTLPYLWRRALRILPAYWVVVAVALFVFNNGHITSASAWLQYLLLVQNYNPHPWWQGTGALGLAQMWSLVVEVSFYLLLPLLAVLLAWLAGRRSPSVSQRAKRLLLGICCFATLSYISTVFGYYPSQRAWLAETIFRSTTWFAAGMATTVIAAWALAERSHDGEDGAAARFCRTIASSVPACWAIAAAAFMIACTPVAGPETLAASTLWAAEIKTALYTVVAAMVIAPVAFQPSWPTPVTRLLGNGVMSFLGRISYGIFLWQFVVIYAFFALTHQPDAFHGGYFAWPTVAGILIVVAAATIALATISYYLIERPAQRLYRARMPRIIGKLVAVRKPVLQEAVVNPAD